MTAAQACVFKGHCTRHICRRRLISTYTGTHGAATFLLHPPTSSVLPWLQQLCRMPSRVQTNGLDGASSECMSGSLCLCLWALSGCQYGNIPIYRTPKHLCAHALTRQGVYALPCREPFSGAHPLISPGSQGSTHGAACPCVAECGYQRYGYVATL